MNSSSTASLELLIDAVAAKAAEKVATDLANERAPVKPRLLTVEQAATYLGRTKDAINHLVGARKLPIVRSDRRVFLDIHDLDHWIEEHKKAA
jgi:excisionase family DNA binding protein